MPETVFPYPGGKTFLADWIIDHFPAHECYVEVFGGGASVLVNKPPSFNEIYNDLDGDLVHFFRVLRENPDDLRGWLDQIPFSREQHQRFKESFYNGDRPDDDVERAGRFFYLRHSQYAGKYCSPSGFVANPDRNRAKWFRNSTSELDHFADRFSEVTVEKMDFEDLIELYDTPDTLFYCDPPYVDEGDELYRHEGEFDHAGLADSLSGIEGKYVCSYFSVPDPLEEDAVEIRGRESAQFMNKGHDDRRESEVERLVMNFDPDETPSFESERQAQQKLTEVA